MQQYDRTPNVFFQKRINRKTNKQSSKHTEICKDRIFLFFLLTDKFENANSGSGLPFLQYWHCFFCLKTLRRRGLCIYFSVKTLTSKQVMCACSYDVKAFLRSTHRQCGAQNLTHFIRFRDKNAVFNFVWISMNEAFESISQTPFLWIYSVTIFCINFYLITSLLEIWAGSSKSTSKLCLLRHISFNQSEWNRFIPVPSKIVTKKRTFDGSGYWPRIQSIDYTPEKEEPLDFLFFANLGSLRCK